jgi:hypothetical protein
MQRRFHEPPKEERRSKNPHNLQATISRVQSFREEEPKAHTTLEAHKTYHVSAFPPYLPFLSPLPPSLSSLPLATRASSGRPPPSPTRHSQKSTQKETKNLLYKKKEFFEKKPNPLKNRVGTRVQFLFFSFSFFFPGEILPFFDIEIGEILEMFFFKSIISNNFSFFFFNFAKFSTSKKGEIIHT